MYRFSYVSSQVQALKSEVDGAKNKENQVNLLLNI